MSDHAIFILGVVVVGLSMTGFIYGFVELKRIHDPD